MKNIWPKIKINNFTYFFILICLLCGYIKNIFIIFLICFIHELGHVFMARILHYKIISIEILPFGGFTTIDQKINSSINKDLMIAMGGILSQVLCLLIVYLFKSNFNIITYNLIVEYNFILIIFNLIPIVPLDGSKIVHLLLERFFPYKKAYWLNYYISITSLVLFFILNYLYNLDNYFIITFLIYKLVMYYKNYPILENRFLLERYIYDIEYNRINNQTKSIKDLQKSVYHYFKDNNRYVSEKEKIGEYFMRKRC